MNSDNSYYVYVILNVEVPGEFKYGDIEFDHLPIYIGKGKNKRQFVHFKNHSLKIESEKNKSLLKYNCISKILKDNLTEVESLKLERDYIELIGRSDLNTGPLFNLTSGGQGVSGYKYTLDQLLVRSRNQSNSGNSFYNKMHNKSTFDRFKRPVYQIDKNSGEILNEFDSIIDAVNKTGSRECHIRDCCNGHRKTHNGFGWRDVNSNYVKKRRSKNNKTSKRKVIQLDLDGNLKGEYDSISDASRSTSIRKCNIINCLSKNRLSAGGFKWEYKKESKHMKYIKYIQLYGK
jgi:hypothetical protein